MIARLARATAWLFLGHAILFGLYWGLLNVPESNVLMLAASTALALLLVVGLGVVQAVAARLLALTTGVRSLRASLLASVPAVLVALVLLGIWVYVVFLLDARYSAHRTEIDAWLIAHGDWTRTAPLHRTIEAVIWFLRFVIAASLTTGLFVRWVLVGAESALHPRRALADLGWKRLAVVTAALLLFVWLPSYAWYWRPASLPPTIAQPAFAAMKLTLLALVAFMGWAIVLWSALPRRPGNPVSAIDLTD